MIPKALASRARVIKKTKRECLEKARARRRGSEWDVGCMSWLLDDRLSMLGWISSCWCWLSRALIGEQRRDAPDGIGHMAETLRRIIRAARFACEINLDAE
jgi:hypothetical protein